MFKIAKILFKHFTVGIDAEENLQLERWRIADIRHEELYRKIADYAFWQEALQEKHHLSESEQWEIVYDKIKKIRKEHRVALVRRFAAVIIPFIVFVALWNHDEIKKILEEEKSQHKSCVSTPRVVVRFADNSSFIVEKDSLFQLKQKGRVLKNIEDTLIVSNTDSLMPNESYQIEVPVGGDYITRLEDGTIVHMDAASTLVVPSRFTNRKREVELYGHAYFIVSPDTIRPFVVKNKGSAIRVLGTEFDLNAYEENALKTTLVKGSVEVSNSKKRVLLKPSQQAIINQQGDIEVREVEVYPVIAWKDKRIVFVNECLDKIMLSLKRWYGIDYLFMTEALKKERFTLDIDRYESVDEVLASIAKTDKVKFSVNGKQILIQKR